MVCFRRGNFTKHLTTKHNISLFNASVLSKSMERQGQPIKKKKGLFAKTHSKKTTLTQSLGESLKCSYCSYTAKWESDLRRHMHVHSIVKRYKCSLCSNKYKYFGDLNVHLRRDHNTKPQANMCQEVTVNADRKASPSSFRCPICSFVSNSKAKLEQHTRLHGNIDKTYQCRICKYQTYWRGDVSRHLFKHHNLVMPKDGSGIQEYIIHRPEIQPQTRRPLAIKSEPAIPTSTNEDKFKNGDQQQTVQMPDSKQLLLKPGSFVCEYPTCQYKTSTAEKMEDHIGVHLNIKKFMCPVCGKRTNWRWDIVKHMVKVHSRPNANKHDVIVFSMDEAKATIEEYLKSQANKVGCKHVKNQLNKTVSFENLDQEANKSQTVETHSVSKFQEPSQDDLMKYELPFACAICNKLGNNKGNIKKHYNYAHPYKEVRIIYRPTGVEFNFETGNIYQKSALMEPIKNESDSQGSPNNKGIKPDSKYSNPKMHGYVKPFKCSICGLRSNWKWDLKKHLRSKHPNKGGFVIMLSIEEAQQTYGTECSLSHPKHEEFLSIKVKEEDGSEKVNEAPSSPSKPVELQENTRIKSNFLIKPKKRVKPQNHSRLWKCSGCKYITTWRRNIVRHMRRFHANENISIMPVPASSSIKLSNKRHIDKSSYYDSLSQENTESNQEKLFWKETKITKPKLDDRTWQCPECPFSSKLRTHIVIHMQKHGMKPFKCGVCSIPFMSRGSLHRHIKNLHQRPDYIKLSKLNIKYDNKNESSNPDNAIVYYWKCRLCNFESAFKSSISQHLQELHNTDDPKYISKAKKTASLADNNLDFESHLRADPERAGKKYHFCNQCPFRSAKKSILAFHMTYHRPSALNKFKCKFCNYFVNTTRLLHQHQRKWHADYSGVQKKPYQPQYSSLDHSQKKQASLAPGRLRCGKCPYSTGSRNDFIYHKQVRNYFHKLYIYRVPTILEN